MEEQEEGKEEGERRRGREKKGGCVRNMLPSCGEVNLLTTWDKRCRGGIKDREEGKEGKTGDLCQEIRCIIRVLCVNNRIQEEREIIVEGG